MSLKELMTLVPDFSAPARVWAEKIKLLLPTSQANDQLLNVIRHRLPPHLFEQLAANSYRTPEALLDKVITLKNPRQQASHLLFNNPQSLSIDQSPSSYFREQVRLTKTALPTCSADQVNEVAWQKTKACLPPQLQQLLLFSSEQSPTEKLLELVDSAWAQQRSSPSLTATTIEAPHNATPTDTAQLVA